MNIEAICQNLDVISSSVCGGHYNRVLITYDEYDYLTSLIGQENPYKGHGDDYIELDYHSEFIPLVEKARKESTLGGAV